jgi:hypothetical protein
VSPGKSGVDARGRRSTPALSQSYIEAKAVALSRRETLEDYRNTTLIAESLEPLHACGVVM